jgi:tRNA modification GTPase
VLAGPPNAGNRRSSTGWSARTGIWSPHPGTTRDTIEADVEIAGLAMRLVDTAGIRAGHDAVEAGGVSRARLERRRSGPYRLRARRVGAVG